MLHGNLRVNPSLPKNWKRLDFYIYWQGAKLRIGIDKESVSIKNTNNTKMIEVEIYGEKYQIKEEIIVRYDN